MTDKATQIVEWLYSNDPTLIERAFAAYTPNLEHVVKLSLQSRSSDLQEIDFANLPLNQVLLDQFFITEYLSKVIEVQIGDELQEVYLIQSQVAEVEIAPSSMDELRGKILGLISAPAQKIASIVKEPSGQLARLVSAHGENMDKSN